MRRLLLALALPISTLQIADAQTRLAVIVVDFPSSQAAPPDTMDWVRQDMAAVDALNAEQSYGQLLLTSDVFGIYRVNLDQTATRSDIALAAQQAAVANGVDLAPYRTGGTCGHFLYVSPSTAFAMAGLGDGCGMWIARAPQYPVTPGVDIAAHELEHHLGEPLHAHGLFCTTGPLTGTCTLQDRGDVLEPMGKGYGHINALKKRERGWLTPTGAYQIRTVTTSGDYLIAPLETASPGVKALLIPGSKQAPVPYVLEYRQPSGFDAFQPRALPSNLFAGVTVHRAINGSELLGMNSPSGAYPMLLDRPALTVGQTFCDPARRVELSVLSATSAGVLTRIRFGHC